MSFFESIPRPTKTYHTTTYERIPKHHSFNGAGKTVLVTGGAAAVGYSISKAFASAGVARIAIISRSLEPQEKAKAELERSFPSTSVLLYQASILDNGRMSEILKEQTRTFGDFSTNVIEPFNLARGYVALPSPGAGRKTIIHISSAAGQMLAPLRSAYGPSKAAITQAVQHLALEHADEANIFSFHPGAFYTPSRAEIHAKDAMNESLSGRFLSAQWDVDELIALKGKFSQD
ncbi:hypothetical protein BCR34DRAFT_638874 [Clohesyomyces aquaticus]|uniref:NAD(P)-binding protein n=1 Tax=Clohesyomyces aquaticus TaxID=1231657 RepID=A0A1Y1YPK8_9PLEO|nr:hypothetical protein BCR34DRAFT_638874 [Clohesyomyces aquaticus]